LSAGKGAQGPTLVDASRRIQAHARVTQNDTQRHLGAAAAQREWIYLSEIIEEFW
jgi:hypothetical protein